MNRRFLVFFTVITSVWALLHFYIGVTLAPETTSVRAESIIPGLWWLAIGVLTVLPVVAMIAGRRGRPGPLKDVLEWAGFTTIGLSTMLLVLALAASILDVRAWLDPRWVTPGILSLAALATIAGGWRARRPGVVHVEVPIAGLPQDLDRFRIVQLSDLHIGPTLKRPFVTWPTVIRLSCGTTWPRWPSWERRTESSSSPEITSTTGTRRAGYGRSRAWDSTRW